MTERDEFERGSEDLPGMLREWVEMRPRWRVVEIGPSKIQAAGSRFTVAVRLIDLDPTPARNHLAITALGESWEPEAMREAIFEALYLFGLHHQTGHAIA